MGFYLITVCFQFANVAMNNLWTCHFDAYDNPFVYRCQCFVFHAKFPNDATTLVSPRNLRNNTATTPRIPVGEIKLSLLTKLITMFKIIQSWILSQTWVLIKNARRTANIWLLTPFSGPIQTTKYVMPSNGINTSRAFDAFLYWRVSAVFADRNFIMSTLTIHF